MNYGATRPDCLVYNPFKAIVTPRPIGWIGTLDSIGGDNLAPYSFFNGLGAYPEQVYFASDGAKHSFINARDRGEFTFSLATEDLAQAMNISSEALPYGTSEFDAAGLKKGEPVEISTPFVADSPAAFECVTIQTLQLEDRTGKLIDRYMVIGEVVRTHIRDEFIHNGRFDTLKARPIARMGYRDYTTVNGAWELERPDD